MEYLESLGQHCQLQFTGRRKSSVNHSDMLVIIIAQCSATKTRRAVTSAHDHTSSVMNMNGRSSTSARDHSQARAMAFCCISAYTFRHRQRPEATTPISLLACIMSTYRRRPLRRRLLMTVRYRCTSLGNSWHVRMRIYKVCGKSRLHSRLRYSNSVWLNDKPPEHAMRVAMVQLGLFSPSSFMIPTKPSSHAINTENTFR